MTKMHIKVFRSTDRYRFERDINSYLDSLINDENVTSIDIKYAPTTSGSDKSLYDAMVIYTK